MLDLSNIDVGGVDRGVWISAPTRDVDQVLGPTPRITEVLQLCSTRRPSCTSTRPFRHHTTPSTRDIRPTWLPTECRPLLSSRLSFSPLLRWRRVGACLPGHSLLIPFLHSLHSLPHATSSPTIPCHPTLHSERPFDLATARSRPPTLVCLRCTRSPTSPAKPGTAGRR